MELGYAIPHDIRIRASANMGFIVKVGCGEFVAANGACLLEAIDEYIGNPDKWEKEYNALPGRGGHVVEEVARPALPDAPSTQPATATEGDG